MQSTLSDHLPLFPSHELSSILTPTKASHLPKRDPLSPDQCAQLLKALGDPDRLRLVQALRSGPCCVSDLATKLELEIANVSHHLGVLRRAGLVVTQRQGKQIIYELPQDVLQRDVNDQTCEHLNLGCCRLEIPG